MNNKTETTLYRTEVTQQKQDTTHNSYIFIRCHFGPLLVFATALFNISVFLVTLTRLWIAIFKAGPNVEWFALLNFSLSSAERLLKSVTMDGSLPILNSFSALCMRTLNFEPAHRHDKHWSPLNNSSPHTAHCTLFGMVSRELQRDGAEAKTGRERTVMVTCKVRTPMQDANTSN